MNGAVEAIRTRLHQAVQRSDVAALQRVDNEVRNVVAHAISHDSAKAAAVLQSLREVYSSLIDTVAGERARLGAELKDLSNNRRALNAYQDAPGRLNP